MRHRHIISGLVLMAVSIVYGTMTANLPVRTLPNTPDPSFFPWINTVLMFALSAALLIHGWLFADRGGSVAGLSAVPKGPTLMLVCFIGYLIILPTLGFVIATIPFFAAMMVIFGERRPAWVAAGSIAVSLLLYVIFRHGFTVMLPRGLFSGIFP